MSFVTTEIQGAVAIVTIDRPKALNALNPEVLADLKAAFEAIDQNTVRCVVLTGAGDKSFVAGADIGSMSTMPMPTRRARRWVPPKPGVMPRPTSG